jgi:hypothetical protein
MIRKLFQLGEWADATEKFLDCLALLGKKKESCFQCFGSGSRRAKMTHKNRKKGRNFKLVKCWMSSFEG